MLPARALRRGRSDARKPMTSPRLKKDREADVDQQDRKKDDHRPPEIGLRPKARVPEEAVADEHEGDRGAAENDDTQGRATRFWGSDADANCSPDAAKGEPPPLSSSFDLVELDEHRPRPVHAIGRQAADGEAEQRPGAVAVGSTSAQSTHERWEREGRGQHHEREDEQRRYDAPRSSGPRRIGRCAVDGVAYVAWYSSPAEVSR